MVLSLRGVVELALTNVGSYVAVNYKRMLVNIIVLMSAT